MVSSFHRPALTLALALSTVFAGCGGGGSDEPVPDTTSKVPAADTSATVSESGKEATPMRLPVLVVRARADLAGGVGPSMSVLVDGKSVGTVAVQGTEPKDYRFTLAAPIADGQGIDIVYGNDGTVGSEDRNLHVLFVSDEVDFALPNGPDAVVDRGVGTAAFDGVNVLPGQSLIFGNGALRLRWKAAAATPSNVRAARIAAARLLQQATFGATTAEVDKVVALGTEGWIAEQLAMPHASVFVADVQAHFDRGDSWLPHGTNYSNRWPAQRFWANVVQRPDQLRRRTAFALHHMLMVSQSDGNLFQHVRPYAQYLDVVNQHAFGNYRDLLEAVALSPAMGLYLSHIRNQPEDATTGRLPDENFAREIMQLFSIGLLELRLDGTAKIDALGRNIETYGNDDVMALARVFTGWSWAFPDNELTAANFRHKQPSYATTGSQRIDLLPMKPYPGQHSTAAKTLFAGKPWAISIPAGTGARESVRMALDGLFRHPNVGPFVARQLIQRMVTSHPSPAYVARVATVFNDNGSGVRGDLAAVVRAILLDTEARTPPNSDLGKLREPVLRLAQWMRAFGATSVSGEFLMSNDGVNLQQQALFAPSVFGYFRPGYVPPNTAMATANRTVPEFQIVSEATVTHWMNQVQQVVMSGLGVQGGATDVVSQYRELVPMAAAGDMSKLLERLDLLLFAGRMTPELRADIAEGVAGVNGQTPDKHLARVRVAVLLAMTAPEYLVQR